MRTLRASRLSAPVPDGTQRACSPLFCPRWHAVSSYPGFSSPLFLPSTHSLSSYRLSSVLRPFCQSFYVAPCRKGTLVGSLEEPGTSKPDRNLAVPFLHPTLGSPSLHEAWGVAQELPNCRHPNLCSWLEQTGECLVRGQTGAVGLHQSLKPFPPFHLSLA